MYNTCTNHIQTYTGQAPSKLGIKFSGSTCQCPQGIQAGPASRSDPAVLPRKVIPDLIPQPLAQIFACARAGKSNFAEGLSSSAEGRFGRGSVAWQQPLLPESSFCASVGHASVPQM